jgi:hypothetical protein
MILLRELYEGESRRAIWFRYSLVLFDLSTIIFLVITSFIKGTPSLEFVDAAIGARADRRPSEVFFEHPFLEPFAKRPERSLTQCVSLDRFCS